MITGLPARFCRPSLPFRLPLLEVSPSEEYIRLALPHALLLSSSSLDFSLVYCPLQEKSLTMLLLCVHLSYDPSPQRSETRPTSSPFRRTLRHTLKPSPSPPGPNWYPIPLSMALRLSPLSRPSRISPMPVSTSGISMRDDDVYGPAYAPPPYVDDPPDFPHTMHLRRPLPRPPPPSLPLAITLRRLSRLTTNRPRTRSTLLARRRRPPLMLGFGRHGVAPSPSWIAPPAVPA